jgi:predicted metalloprotease with PDZ domain
MQILLRFPNRAARMAEVTQIMHTNADVATFQLPAWRPGRYELQNYSKNIMYFEAFDHTTDVKLPFHKSDRNTWLVQCAKNTPIRIQYKYYCHQQDAGGSYIDDDVVYINPINLCMSPVGYEEPIELLLELPKAYKISCGLSFESTNGATQSENMMYHAICKSWYELYDSPLFASEHLIAYQYTVQDVEFKLWFYGIKELNNSEKAISDFKKFTQYQFDLFGSFPFDAYHFQFLILPYKYYHGVEHRNSTVIVLGNQDEFDAGKLEDDFLGISSHELFHAWNICKIRPKELFPYNYHAAPYFNTGFVAEGFTTYYGDYALYKSGVISKEQYEKELEVVVKRHFSNMGNTQFSLSESSFDLMVDGYQPSHPERKVSIYDKGALISLIFDAHIQHVSKNEYSLDHVLQTLWIAFGAQGKAYAEQDILKALTKYSNESIKDIYEECVFGKSDLKDLLIQAVKIKDLNLEIEKLWSNDLQLKGFVCAERDGKKIVEKVHPKHPIYNKISIYDEMVAETSTYFNVIRNGRSIRIQK